MADRVSYPVFVEYTQRHIVWVEADSQERAVERLASWPYESTSQDNLADSGVSVNAPRDRFDWEDVYGDNYGNPYTTEADAHVETHRFEMFRRQREAEKKACTEAGHPVTRKPLSDGRRFCEGCSEYLPAPSEVS